VNPIEDGVGVVAFLQQHDAFDSIGIVDNRAVGDGWRADLPQANLGACTTVAMSLTLMARR